jgi:hypothetical protein
MNRVRRCAESWQDGRFVGVLASDPKDGLAVGPGAARAFMARDS